MVPIICLGDQEAEALPVDALTLLIRPSADGMDTTEGSLGTLVGPCRGPEMQHSVVYATLRNGPLVQTFLMAAKAQPGRVWIVLSAFTLDTIAAALVLAARVEAAQMGVDVPSVPAHMSERILLVDEACRHARGWVTRWPGLQKEDAFWLEDESPVWASMLLEWVNRRIVSRQAATAAIGAYLRGVTTHRTHCPDMDTAEMLGRDAKNPVQLMKAAAAGAYLRRHAEFSAYESAKALPELYGDGLIAHLDVTDVPEQRPGTPTPIWYGATLGFAQSPVVVVFSGDKTRNDARQASIWLYNDTSFDEAAFLKAIATEDAPEAAWQATQIDGKPTRQIAPTIPERSVIPSETLLRLVERYRR